LAVIRPRPWATSRRTSAASWRSKKEKERKPSQIFPTFLALNSNGAVGPGYLPASYGPFKVTPSTGGIANTTNPAGQTRFNNRMKLLHTLDDGLRQDSPNGNAVTDYDSFYDAAQGMMYNPVVNQAFGFYRGGEPALRQ
jgi:hypothetical protein